MSRHLVESRNRNRTVFGKPDIVSAGQQEVFRNADSAFHAAHFNGKRGLVIRANHSVRVRIQRGIGKRGDVGKNQILPEKHLRGKGLCCLKETGEALAVAVAVARHDSGDSARSAVNAALGQYTENLLLLRVHRRMRTDPVGQEQIREPGLCKLVQKRMFLTGAPDNQTVYFIPRSGRVR